MNTLLPESTKIILMMDNLNTNKEASPYEAYPPKKAHALCERFEMHHAPKQGIRLNMAEVGIGLLSRTCLDRWVGSVGELETEVTTCLEWENKNSKPGGNSPTKTRRSTSSLFIRQF